MRWIEIFCLGCALTLLRGAGPLQAAEARTAPESVSREVDLASGDTTGGEAGDRALPGDAARPGEAEGSGTVRGRVVDDAKAAVPGAVVTVDGTTLSATTGPTGSFEISGVPTGKRRLLVTRINYADQAARRIVLTPRSDTLHALGDTTALGAIVKRAHEVVRTHGLEI